MNALGRDPENCDLPVAVLSVSGIFHGIRFGLMLQIETISSGECSQGIKVKPLLSQC
jgi:hypothetical protein